MVLFSPFNITCLVAQENAILSECCIMHNMTFWSLNVVLLRSFKKLAYFNVKCHFVYTMKIYKYERTFFANKYAHNITQYGIKNICIVP